MLLVSVVEDSMKRLIVEIAGFYWHLAARWKVKADHTVSEDEKPWRIPTSQIPGELSFIIVSYHTEENVFPL